MSKWADNGKEWQEPETGNHVARCIRVIELGTQRKEYQGEVSYKRQTMVVWELPTELMDDGKPFVVSHFYTASLNEKANLRRDLENWRGKPFTPAELEGFDQRNILDKPCLLNLIKNKRDRVVVGSVAALPKGMQVPPRVNETLFYDLDAHDDAVWQKLSDGIKRMIDQSEERKPKANATTAGAESNGGGWNDAPPEYVDDDGSIPF